MSSARLGLEREHAVVELTHGLAERYRLWAKVEYDGTDFFGFQIQAKERTVQGEIERVLEAVTGHQTRVVGAGRTDRGVHARGQVIAFETVWRHSLGELHRAVNAVLDADVALLEVGVAREAFHPRFSATSRTYRYTLLCREQRSPLARRTAWHVVKELDVSLMARTARLLEGRHDFATFGRPPQGENTERTVLETEWRKQGDFLVFDITADAFLYRMVRSMVGTLVQVGWGQMSQDEFETILQARDRNQGKYLAPAHGLCLMRVDYPEGALQ